MSVIIVVMDPTLNIQWKKKKIDKIEKWSWSLSLRLVYPVLHQPPGANITSRSAVRIRINFWRMVGLYISFGDWANALECWRSPSLRLVIPGIAVSPGVTHSDSRIVFVTGTVVKPQQPPPHPNFLFSQLTTRFNRAESIYRTDCRRPRLCEPSQFSSRNIKYWSRKYIKGRGVEVKIEPTQF